MTLSRDQVPNVRCWESLCRFSVCCATRPASAFQSTGGDVSVIGWDTGGGVAGAGGATLLRRGSCLSISGRGGGVTSGGSAINGMDSLEADGTECLRYPDRNTAAMNAWQATTATAADTRRATPISSLPGAAGPRSDRPFKGSFQA
jgi:hypothetical protein